MVRAIEAPLQFIGTIEAESPRAICFQDWFWAEPKWFPKSQITELKVEDDTIEVIALISAWMCKKEGVSETT